MSDTYVSMVAQLAAVMAQLSRREAALLAQELTERVNRRVAAAASGEGSAREGALDARVARAFPPHLMSVATLALPWEAFRRAHDAPLAEFGGEAVATRLVCSLPEVLGRRMRAAGQAGLWSGSLLDAIGAVIDGATREVVMMNPYWSTLGVQALLRRIARPSLAGLPVTILTQPLARLDAAERQGAEQFIAGLSAKGARCRVLAPPAQVWPIPLLHAKAIVADHRHAYLGSANLTGSGMDFSVELGLCFGGALARHLSDWLGALAEGLQPWDDAKP